MQLTLHKAKGYLVSISDEDAGMEGNYVFCLTKQSAEVEIMTLRDKFGVSYDYKLEETEVWLSDDEKFWIFFRDVNQVKKHNLDHLKLWEKLKNSKSLTEDELELLTSVVFKEEGK